MFTQERCMSLTDQIRREVTLNRDFGDHGARGRDGKRPWGEWGLYRSSIDSYNNTFCLALGSSIASFVRDRKSPVVVVDIMSPSYALRSLFEKIPNKQKLGIAVSLEDLKGRIGKEEDDRLNVKQIAGDIMLSTTWRAIDKAMQGRKADLIMERAISGLDIIPPHPKLYAILINKAWRILSDQGGVMLLQTPSDRELVKAGISIQDVVSNLKAKGINARYFDLNVVTTTGFLVLKITKTVGSPNKLPF